MKKTFIALAMVAAMSFGLVGCHDDDFQPREMGSKYGSSPFVIVEKGYDYEIVYHKDTKVMYVISRGYREATSFELMVKADGMPMVYEED